MITVINITIGLLIGAFIGIISAAVLAMSRDSGKSARKGFADWLKVGVYFDKVHYGIRPL